MKIIIVGAGKTGYAVARILVGDNHDITVIDEDGDRIENLTNNLDVMGLVGNGASFEIQQEAGIDSTELLIALTSSDETNMLCCLIARKNPKCSTFARISNPTYMEEMPYLKRTLGLSLDVNSELIAAEKITRLCKVPSASEIETFVQGHVDIVKVPIPEGCFLDGQALSDVMKKVKEKVLICAVDRDGKAVIPPGSFVLQSGDNIAIVGNPSATGHFIKKMGVKGYDRVHSAILVGANHITEYVAKLLISQGIEVKIIDRDHEKCERLSLEIPEAMVINADPSKTDVLLEEGLEHTDAFATLSESDEVNMLLSMFAKKNADCRVVTLINHTNYMDVIAGIDLGTVMSLTAITAESVLGSVRALADSRGSNMQFLSRIMEGKVSALEFIIGDDCPLSGIRLMDMKTKDDTLVACIDHMGRIEIPDGSSSFSSGDNVVVVTTRSDVNSIEDIVK